MTQPETAAFAQLLDTRLADFVAYAVASVRRVPGYDDEFLGQAFRGFGSMIRAALDDDLAPRDQYISGVFVGVRDAGLPLSRFMPGLVETGIILATWTIENGAGDAIPWITRFMSEYSEILAETYEK